MRYRIWLTVIVLGAGLFTGLFWAMPDQSPGQYTVYTAQQPRCSAAEAGDLTTFVGKGITPFRAECVRDGGIYVWDALPGPVSTKGKS